ncbi:MAG: PDZ domain-containing protein [Acidobacteriales bacterium]|nr:PDZ domain-containing protein [Terriglobales bacterium]
MTLYSQAGKGELASNSNIGIIGGEILRRFTAIFDYSRKRMILEPNAALDEPYEHDMSGLFLLAEGKVVKTIKAHRVFANSPAAEAGLREGDVIVAIDDKPAQELTLNQLKQMFRQEGREYALSVRRNGELLTAKIKLRRLV